MSKSNSGGDRQRKTDGPVSIGEFRARLAEMISRAEAGEDVVIARGDRPVARLVPLKGRPPRRLDALKDLLSAEEIKALSKAIEAPMAREDQSALEGGLTDEWGIARR